MRKTFQLQQIKIRVLQQWIWQFTNPIADIKGIPEFWLTALKNNAAVAESITDNDEAALVFLKDIKHSNIEGEKVG